MIDVAESSQVYLMLLFFKGDHLLGLIKPDMLDIEFANSSVLTTLAISSEVKFLLFKLKLQRIV